MDRQVSGTAVREEAGEQQSRPPRKPYRSPRLIQHGAIVTHTAVEVPSGLPA